MHIESVLSGMFMYPSQKQWLQTMHPSVSEIIPRESASRTTEGGLCLCTVVCVSLFWVWY